MMTMKPKAGFTRFVISALFPLSFSVYGSPSIDTVGSEENTVMIKGEQFGSNDLEVAVTDTIDNRMVTTTDRTDYNVAYEGYWEELGSQWSDPLSIKENAGPLGLKNNDIYWAKGKSYNGYPSLMSGKTNRALYVQWWFKPSEDPDHSGGSNKFIRVWDESDGKHTRISWTQMHLTYGAVGGEGEASWGSWPGQVGEWNLMEIYVDSDDNSIQAWVNSEMVHDIDDYEKSKSDKGLTIKQIGFTPSVGDNYEDIEINIDNIYYSSSRARVVVSKHEKWSDASKKHFSVLPISWSDDEIEVELPRTIAKNIRDYFFYVVDEAGNANRNGVHLCQECPEPVKNLGIE